MKYKSALPLGLVSLLRNCVVDTKRCKQWLALKVVRWDNKVEEEETGSLRILSDRRTSKVTARDNLMEAAIFLCQQEEMKVTSVQWLAPRLIKKVSTPIKVFNVSWFARAKIASWLNSKGSFVMDFYLSSDHIRQFLGGVQLDLYCRTNTSKLAKSMMWYHQRKIHVGTWDALSSEARSATAKNKDLKMLSRFEFHTSCLLL